MGQGNLTDAEREAYDEALFSGNDGQRRIAVQGLKARYEAVNGRAGKLVQPQSNERAQGDLFNSRAEMIAAMGDPKYAKDEAYRKAVERKILNSANAGIDLW